MPSTISGSLETRFSWTYNRAAGARQHAHTTCRADERHSLAIAHCVYVQDLLFSTHGRFLTASAIPTMAALTKLSIPTMATLTRLYLLWLYLLGAMLTTTATTAFCLLLNAFSAFPMLIAFGEE